MRKILAFLLLGLIVSCVDNKKGILEQTNDELRLKNDSLQVVIDSLMKSKSYLFEKALINEKKDINISLEIYEEILKDKKTDLLAVYAEERLLKLTHNELSLKEIFRLADTLIFRQHNDKCGEWGGDVEIIKIYCKKNYAKGRNKEELFAIYQKNEYDCNSLESFPYESDIKSKKHFFGPKQLNNESAKIAEECILDLLKHKLTNNNAIGHAGITNTVELKGSIAFVKEPSILIDDYPSFGWRKFHLLKMELMN
jgi:hypothetical protein